MQHAQVQSEDTNNFQCSDIQKDMYTEHTPAFGSKMSIISAKTLQNERTHIQRCNKSTESTVGWHILINVHPCPTNTQLDTVRQHIGTRTTQLDTVRQHRGARTAQLDTVWQHRVARINTIRHSAATHRNTDYTIRCCTATQKRTMCQLDTLWQHRGARTTQLDTVRQHRGARTTQLDTVMDLQTDNYKVNNCYRDGAWTFWFWWCCLIQICSVN